MRRQVNSCLKVLFFIGALAGGLDNEIGSEDADINEQSGAAFEGTQPGLDQMDHKDNCNGCNE